jgi:NTP pyrophosphatase (non-canonical NTP hydrolase)
MEKLIKKAHGVAKEKGFWDEERNVPEMLMLVVSELSEALEALRKGHYADPFATAVLAEDLNNWDDSLKDAWKNGFEKAVKSSFEDEIADVAIRLFDMCGGLKIDLEKHIEMKMKYNSLRPYKHGKKF